MEIPEALAADDEPDDGAEDEFSLDSLVEMERDSPTVAADVPPGKKRRGGSARRKKTSPKDWQTTRAGLGIVSYSGLAVAVAVLVVLVTLMGLVPPILFARLRGFGIFVGLGWFSGLTCLAWLLWKSEIEFINIIFGAFAYSILVTVVAFASPKIAAVVVGVALLAALAAIGIAGVATLVGWLMCATVPGESRLKPIAILFVVAMLGAVVCYGMAGLDAVKTLSSFMQKNAAQAAALLPAVGLPYLIAAHLSFLAGCFLFAFFLRGISLFFRDASTAKYIERFLGFLVLTAICGVAVQLAVAFDVVQGALAAGLVLGVQVLWLVAALRFYRCVSGTAGAIHVSAR